MNDADKEAEAVRVQAELLRAQDYVRELEERVRHAEKEMRLLRKELSRMETICKTQPYGQLALLLTTIRAEIERSFKHYSLPEDE